MALKNEKLIDRLDLWSEMMSDPMTINWDIVVYWFWLVHDFILFPNKQGKWRINRYENP